MKTTSILKLSLIICLLVSQLSIGQKSASGISHSFFVAGPQFTGIIGEAGEVIWDSKKPGARDGYVLKNGNILICWGDEVREYNKKKEVILTYTGVLTFVLSIFLLIVLYTLVTRTRYGRSMRAVAENKQTAALMGINVDQIISNTFIISGALGGAAGVMWGIHNGIIYHFVGFIPGLKAFTAAVLGGIGSIPGAMVGGLLLGMVESVGPAALGLDFQLKDVIAFSILVLILIFRPSGIVGEVLSEEKV